jgi:hypothetical protein
VEYRVVVEPELKSKGFTDLQAREIVQTATKAWILASCESKLSKQPSPSIKLLDVDEQRCAGGPLGIAAETSNEIRFMDGDSPDLGVLAKTKRRFRASGALASSTIQVFRQRGEGNQVAEERMTPEQLKDYRTNVVRHELGHFLGLAHSNVADSIMYFQYNSQASVPLTADDRAAICEVYPPDAPPGQGCSVSAVESSNYAREASAIPPLVFVSWALVTVGARGRRRGAQPGRRSRRGLPKCP